MKDDITKALGKLFEARMYSEVAHNVKKYLEGLESLVDSNDSYARYLKIRAAAMEFLDLMYKEAWRNEEVITWGDDSPEEEEK